MQSSVGYSGEEGEAREGEQGVNGGGRQWELCQLVLQCAELHGKHANVPSTV